jgi:hypothetical protein
VLSCLPDERWEETGEWKYCYGCDTRLREAKVPRLVVCEFESGHQHQHQHQDGEATSNSNSNSNSTINCNDNNSGGSGGAGGAEQVLRGLLTGVGRVLSADQWDHVRAHIQGDSTALHLHLVFRVAKDWASYDLVSLPAGMFGVLGQILDGIEKDYGVLLTRLALGLITFAVDGVSDNEMVDLVSLDADVLSDVFQYSTPNIRRLPNHVWMRLRNHMAGLLVERQHGCMGWYHRQLQEYAERRYGDLKTHVHILMGRYFADLLDPLQRDRQRISDQPVTLTPTSVFLDTALVNNRRAREAAVHLVRSTTLISEAVIEICDLQRICASAKSDNGFTLVSLLAELVEVVERYPDLLSAPLKQRLHHYYRWLRRGISAIVQHPAQQIAASCSLQPQISIARQELGRYLRRTQQNQQQQEGGFQANCWYRGVVLGNQIDFGAEVAALMGHTSFVYCVAFSPSGAQVVSGSHDATLRLWDAGTGAEMATMRGHLDFVNSVAFHPGGLQVVSGSDDKTVRVWDTSTGAQLHVLIGHRSAVKAVAYNLSGAMIASAGCWDNTVRLWTNAGAEVAVLHGHVAAVNDVAFAPDSLRVASASGDKTGDHVRQRCVCLFPPSIVWTAPYCLCLCVSSYLSDILSVCIY